MKKSVSASRKDWWLATLLAFAAVGGGVLLGGLSAWFLGSVAIAGLSATAFTFNFHMPAAFVRLFAIGRTASRYGERLMGHKAALADQVSRRVGLFASMAAAPGVRMAGWQLGDQARLADYLDDVEDVDYARLRAGLPSLTIAAAIAALLAASAIVAPLSLLTILSSLLVAGLVGRRMMNAGAVALKRARTRKRESAERLGAAMASAVSLKAERVWDAESSAAMSALRIADLEILSLRRLQARFDAIASLFGPAAGFSVIAAAWTVGDRGQSLLAPIFLAFASLALGESINGASRILIAKLRRSAARTEIDKWTKGAERLAQTEALKAQPRELRHEHLQRISPSGTPISKRPLALHLRAGSPTVLVGASGAGKTSLLKQIAGWIGNDEISSQEEVLSPEQRRALTTLVLHDAAILDDTVRSNLFALGYSDAVIWAALKSVEIDERVRAAGGLDAWITQDRLSLGEAQRLNLARAWLASNPIVLLDEPMEHLDTTQGQRILRRLTDHLRDRIVVISTHRPRSLHNGAMVDLHP